jgi:putative FmdB family regulatory protein
MPLYEYRCSSCGDVFEVIQKFSDEPLTVHDGCGGAVERLLCASALQFKGTGWYVTDYARGGNGKGKTSEEAKSESKTESKDSKKDPKKDTSGKSEAKPSSTSSDKK